MEPIHILLVEDNEGDILLTTEALEERRLTKKISVVRDGKEALDFLFRNDHYSDAETPELILLDINLPKKNGLEVLQIIKSTQGLQHIPVIIFTTSSSEKDLDFCYNNHVNCFITKPVDIEEFAKVINKIENFWLNTITLPTKG